MSFKNNLKKIMVCGASLLMALSAGAGISNVSANRVSHSRHLIIYRSNSHRSRRAHQAKVVKGTKTGKAKVVRGFKRAKRTGKAKVVRGFKRANKAKAKKNNKRAKAANKHKRVNKKSKKFKRSAKAKRAKKAKKSRRAHKSASDESDFGFPQGAFLGSSLVNTKENEFKEVTTLSDPTPSVELRWGLRTEGFRRGLLAGFKVTDAQSKKEHVVQIGNNKTAKQLKTLLNIGKIKNKKTYNRVYNKVMKQMKAREKAVEKKAIEDADDLDQNTTD